MTRATRSQIKEAIVALTEIQLNRITRQGIVCCGCGAENEDDCLFGCWAAVVEECAVRMSELLWRKR